MTRTPYAIILGLLLALPGAVASAEPTQLTALSVTAVGPDPGAVSGPLVLFELRNPLAPGLDAPPAVPIFSVTGPSVHLEVDHSETSTWSDEPLPPLVGYNHLAETSQSEHTRVRIEETANRRGYYVHVYPTLDYPAPTVTLSKGCFRMATAEEGQVKREFHFGPPRPPLNVSTEGTLRVTRDGCQATGTQVHVEGTFVLHLWQVDALVADTSGEWLLQTGRIQAAGAETGPAGFGRSQEAFLTVRDGTFDIPLTSEAVLHARFLEGDIDGTVRLQQANGRLQAAEGPVFLRGSDVEVRGGPIHLVAEGHGRDPVGVRMDQGWREADIDGQRVTSASALRQAPAPAFLALAAVLALAALRRTARPGTP
jgi:hypothetical protein